MPLLIYYRQDGSIVNHHLAPEAWEPEELKKKIEEYNAEHPKRPRLLPGGGARKPDRVPSGENSSGGPPL